MRRYPAGGQSRLQLFLGVVAALLLILGLAAYGVWPHFAALPAHQVIAGAGQPASETSGAGGSAFATDTIADIVSRTSPAVVKIETVVPSQGENPFANDPLFRQFFGNEFPFGPANRPQRGVGSGFIVSPDGYILTNDHVVEGASSVMVTVAGRPKAYQARVIEENYSLDLALVKIDAGGNLPTLVLGDSDRARVGDWVIAIGNPYGLDHTVTVGVLSAKARPVSIGSRDYSNLLQTDASINPGNSGGPLLNLAGQVIGINTAVSTSGQGIGFAIPASTVKPVLVNWVNHKPAGYLGVSLGDVPAGVATSLGLPTGQGAYVFTVLQGSAAQDAGLRPGDVIILFNGRQVNGPDDLAAKIQGTSPGTVVHLVVLRHGTRVLLSTTLGRK